MSGIAGLLHLDGSPVDGGIVSAMSEAMIHRGSDGNREARSGPVGFAHRHFWITPEEVGEAQPLEGPDGTLLVLDGRVDNRDEIIARLGLPPTVSDAACLLAAYGAWGERLCERLVGDFAFSVYHPGSRTLLLVRDPIGLRPLYYHVGTRFLAFASEIKALLRHPAIPARPDDEGVADYLLLGARPVDRLDVTCFAGIRALPPAHVLRVGLNGLQPARRYWDFDPAYRIRLGRFEDYAEAYRERFAEAVRRRTRSAHPVAVSVSGGLDSSAILCQAETLRRAGSVPCPAVLGVSYVGEEGSTTDEREYLHEIERAYGVSIQRTAGPVLFGVVDGAALQAWHCEAPFLDSLWQITRAIDSAAAGGGARRMLLGHWGDQMLYDTAYLVDLINALAWGTVRRHLSALRDWHVREEVRALRTRLAFDLLRHHVPPRLLLVLKWARWRLRPPQVHRQWLNPGFRSRALQSATVPASLGREFESAHARALYLETRSKYSVHCMEWNNKIAALHGLDHAFPFLDRDLIQFLMAIPGEMVSFRGVPRALAREGMAGVLPDAIRQRRWKGDFTRAVNLGAANDLLVAREWFARPSRAEALGFVDGTRMAAELDSLARRIEGPDCVAGWEVADLIGLESWSRVFFNHGPTEA
jgi:asparagine synthase (glutamine-hydrolysing)